MMHFSRVIGAATLTTMVLSQGPLRADPSASEKAMAETLFRDAKKLLTDGQIPQACEKLSESQRLDPKPGTILNLAVCHEQEGKTATAWAEYQEAAAQNVRAKREDRARFAREQAAAIEKRLSWLTIEVPSPAEGLEITLDGRPLGKAIWGSPAPLDPGSHELTASAPHKVSWSSRVSLAVGPGRQQVVIPALNEMAPPPASVSARAPAAASAPPQAPAVSSVPLSAPPPPLPDSGPSRRTVGFLAGGVGLALAVTGSYFGLRTFSQKNQGDKLCHGSLCSQDGLDHQADARVSAKVSTITFVLAAAGVGVGAYLLLTPSDPKSSASLRLGPALGPSLAGLNLDGSW